MLWVIRGLWLTLPISVGAALGDRVTAYDTSISVTFAIIAYALWAVGLVALLVPRDISFTALRIVACTPFVSALWAFSAPSTAVGIVSVMHAAIAGVFALSNFVAAPCADAQSYGDELRVALRTPPLMLPVTAMAVIVVNVGIAAGPLFIANQRYLVGAIATVLGLACAFVMMRSLHTLSKRFCVFVPAGMAIADSLKLIDPVLLPRDRVIGLVMAPASRAPVNALDTRLGAVVGSLALSLNEPGQFAIRADRKQLETVSSSLVLFTPLRPMAFLTTARARGLIAS